MIEPFDLPNDIGTMAIVNDNQGGTFNLIQLNQTPE